MRSQVRFLLAPLRRPVGPPFVVFIGFPGCPGVYGRLQHQLAVDIENYLREILKTIGVTATGGSGGCPVLISGIPTAHAVGGVIGRVLVFVEPPPIFFV